MTPTVSEAHSVEIVAAAGGSIPDWKLAKELGASPRDLADLLQHVVAAGKLRRFHQQNVPHYGLPGPHRSTESRGVMARKSLAEVAVDHLERVEEELAAEKAQHDALCSAVKEEIERLRAKSKHNAALIHWQQADRLQEILDKSEGSGE